LVTKRSDKLKIILMQLPHPSYLDRNLPLAPGYLKASAYKHGLLDDVEVEIFDPFLSDYAGCQMLIDAIVSRRPDILGFSLYLWNVERTLHIINGVKANLPDLRVIVGGPEVTKDSSYILSNTNIDVFIFGEGEITFVEYIKHVLNGDPEIDEIPGIFYRKNDEIIVNKKRENIADLDLIPSPYLLGYIDPKKYREMMIFTMKGCLLGCTYCSWTTRGRLRAYTVERLREELLLARKTGEEMIVSIIDSAFNLSPIFFDFCDMAQEINKDKSLKFNCFIQADLVDEIVAKILKDSNFTGVEVGLQSSNPKVLTNINRHMELARFLKGISCLRKEGVPVKVDVILGLPGDSLESFEETLKFIHDNEIDPLIFNLSLGHGTKLSRQTDSFGAEVQASPPFYLLGSDTFPNSDLKIALDRHREISADMDKKHNLGYPILPLTSNYSNTIERGKEISFLKNLDFPIRAIVLDLNGTSEISDYVNCMVEAISHKIGIDLSILLQGTFEDLQQSIKLLESFLEQVNERNPHISWNIFFDTNDYDISYPFMEKVKQLINRSKVFLDHRDELFPEHVTYVRRRGVSSFLLLPYDSYDGDIPIRESKCIRTASIHNNEEFQSKRAKLFQANGCGYLIEFSAKLDSPSLREILESLNEDRLSGKDIFFKDPVVQRMWERDYLKVTPGLEAPHYELKFDSNMNMSWKFFDENELLWNAIIKWKMIKSEYSSLDFDDIVGIIVSNIQKDADEIELKW